MTSPDGPRLNDQQHEARDAYGVSVALSAGAGCGKTTVLTERFLRLLERNRTPLSRIIALTFTEKAARELRDRIRTRCRQKLREHDADTAAWRNVSRGLEAAPIGTFHGFCARLLQRFAIEAGQEPGFTVLEETVTATLRDEALEGCVRSWLVERNPDFRELAVDLGVMKARNLVGELIEQQTRGDLEAAASRDANEVVACWESYLHEHLLAQVATDLRAEVMDILPALRANECPTPKMSQKRARMLELLPLCGDPTTGFLDLLEQLREVINFAGAPAPRWSHPDDFPALYERLTGFKKRIVGVLDALGDRDAATTLKSAGLSQRLARLVLEAVRAFDAVKTERGALDFDDLQVKVRDLLRNPPEPVRHWLETGIDFVLVDEFQDTDEIQSEIINRLAGMDAIETGKLFLVGDAKQSIYGFRGARPDIFDQWRETLPDGGRMQLTVNYRSVPEILDFVNALFAETFPDYDSVHVLQPDPNGIDRAGRQAIAFVWPCAEEAIDPAPRIDVQERRKTEALWLARLIRQRLEESNPERWTVRDRTEPGTVRTARPSDVVMLFRSLKDLASYESALAGVGLDYYVVGGSAFYGQQEVLDLINILSALENPNDSLALAASLRGPLGCVSDEGLYWLSMKIPGDLASGLERWPEIAELSDRDRTHVGRFHQHLERWRASKDRMPIGSLLDRILVESGYEAATLTEFLGDRRRANLRKLVRMARQYDMQGGMTLAAFVARLRIDWHNPPREEQAATTDEHGETIRLMSIHQAKGLEFPIVILPDLNRKLNQDQSAVSLSHDLGVVASPTGEPDDDQADGSEKDRPRSLGWQLHRFRRKREEEREALRLFYVAATRAQDVLVLSASLKPSEKAVSPALRLLDARFDRETGDCRATLPAGWQVPAVQVVRDEPPPPSVLRERIHRPGPMAIARLIHRFGNDPGAVSVGERERGGP